MNYFEFFGLPISFFLDEEKLRHKFYENSRRLHPDFFTLEADEKQAEILERASLNNQAYRVLSDFDKRMKYVLELKGLLEEEGKNEVPQDFLLEMMDLNETLMELEFDFDEATYRQALGDVKNLERRLLEEVRPALENFDEKTSGPPELIAVKDFYLKKRYLLRILENLDRFAPASKEAS